MTPRRALVLAVLSLGCAMSPARSRTPRYCVPTRREVPRGGATTPAGPPPPAPVVLQTETLTRATGTASDEAERRHEDIEPPCMPPDGRIRALEGEVAQGLAAVSAPTADCRSACRATSGVCAASEEICRLTGDGAAPAPLDARCGRAREACSDATRQRADRCPVCPTE